jgi:gelsolin
LIIEEIANFNQTDLDTDDVMILDALNVIYVWVGAGANQVTIMLIIII